MAPHTQSLNPSTLRIIRLALLSGLLLFGAVVWYLTASGSFTAPMDAEAFFPMQIAFVALLGGAGGALFVVHQRWKAATAPAQKASFSIIGWALGEAPALFGGVLMLLTSGNVLYYLCGLILFIIAWLLFPINDGAA